MAVAATVEQSFSIGGNQNLYIGTLAVTGTYTTGGETVDLGSNERLDVLVASSAAGGFLIRWDRDNQKALFYYYDYDAVADGAAIQVANAANHTAANGAVFFAIGQ